MKRKIGVVSLIAIILTGCGQDWEGFVYPNKNDLTSHVGIGHYKTLEECRAAAIAALQQISSVERGDYECGLNCKESKDLYGIKVCEETLD